MGVAGRLAIDPEVRLTGHVFERAYETAPAGAWRAPGGLCLLDGPGGSLAVALPWGVIVAAGPHPEGLVELYSMNHHAERFAVQPESLSTCRVPSWASVCVPVVAPYVEGVRLVINQELPAEMGLLGDASAVAAISLALSDLFPGFPGSEPSCSFDPAYLAARRARARHALFVPPDGPGSAERVPFDLMAAGLRLLIMDVGSEEGVPGFGGSALAAAEALRVKNPAALGPLLTAAHEPGVPLLDLALRTAASAGALGGRAIGRCAVALVPMAAVPKVRAVVTTRLSGAARRPPRFLTAISVDGARRTA